MMRGLVFPPGVSLYAHDNRHVLAQSLAQQIAVWLQGALSVKPRALLAVAAGRTPITCMQVLSRIALDWARVDVVLTDDRWVEEFHIDSHGASVKQHLLQNLAASARFIALKTPDDTAKSGCARLEPQLRQLHWPVDVLVLGMGSEGHIAGLFPFARGLDEALSTDAKIAALTPPKAPHERISLSLSVLKSAKHKVLFFNGASKSITMSKALDEVDDVKSMPVRGLLEEELMIYWSP